MKKIPFTNETKRYVTIGNVTIPPGMTCDVEETLHPDYKPQQVQAAASGHVDIVQMLQSGPLDELLKCLPELSREDLDRLDTAEQLRQTPRKTVLAAITKLQLADANQQLDAGQAKPAADAVAPQA